MSREILVRAAPPANARLPYGADPSQFGDVRLPIGDGPFPVVVAVHGGFWRDRYDLEYLGHLCAALATEGIATWNIEYRRLGQPGGGWPGTLLDVAAALDYLATLAAGLPLDLARVVTVGHSAGGQLAFWLAARRRLQSGSSLFSPTPLSVVGAVSVGGVVDLNMGWEMALSDRVVEQFLGGAPDTVPERYADVSPRALLPFGVPQALVHGTHDESVPLAISAAYQTAATAAGDSARLHALDGVDHFDPVDPLSDAWAVTRDTIVSLLS